MSHGCFDFESEVYIMSKHINDNKHLTLDERKIIQTGIENRSNKVYIAKTIGKDSTTIAKEIRKYIQKSTYLSFYLYS